MEIIPSFFFTFKYWIDTHCLINLVSPYSLYIIDLSFVMTKNENASDKLLMPRYKYLKVLIIQRALCHLWSFWKFAFPSSFLCYLTLPFYLIRLNSSLGGAREEMKHSNHLKRVERHSAFVHSQLLFITIILCKQSNKTSHWVALVFPLSLNLQSTIGRLKIH